MALISATGNDVDVLAAVRLQRTGNCVGAAEAFGLDDLAGWGASGWLRQDEFVAKTSMRSLTVEVGAVLSERTPQRWTATFWR